MIKKNVHDDYKGKKPDNLSIKAELWISASIITSFAIGASILGILFSFGSTKIVLYLGLLIISSLSTSFSLKKAREIIKKENPEVKK